MNVNTVDLLGLDIPRQIIGGMVGDQEVAATTEQVINRYNVFIRAINAANKLQCEAKEIAIIKASVDYQKWFIGINAGFKVDLRMQAKKKSNWVETKKRMKAFGARRIYMSYQNDMRKNWESDPEYRKSIREALAKGNSVRRAVIYDAIPIIGEGAMDGIKGFVKLALIETASNLLSGGTIGAIRKLQAFRQVVNVKKVGKITEPLDDYDVVAWERYYKANPGVKRSVGAQGVNNVKKLWQINKYDKVVDAGKFGKIFRDPKTKLWWSKDTAKHGDSAWKVFKADKKGLRHFRDADKYGDYMTGKHKGPVGEFIPWKNTTGK